MDLRNTYDTVATVARRRDVSTKAIYDLIERGKLAAVKTMDGKILIPRWAAPPRHQPALNIAEPPTPEDARELQFLSEHYTREGLIRASGMSGSWVDVRLRDLEAKKIQLSSKYILYHKDLLPRLQERGRGERKTNDAISLTMEVNISSAGIKQLRELRKHYREKDNTTTDSRIVATGAAYWQTTPSADVQPWRERHTNILTKNRVYLDLTLEEALQLEAMRKWYDLSKAAAVDLAVWFAGQSLTYNSNNDIIDNYTEGDKNS